MSWSDQHWWRQGLLLCLHLGWLGTVTWLQVLVMFICFCCRACKAVSFSTDGHKLFSGSDDTTVRCWDLATQECLLTLQGHEVGV